MRCPSAPAPAHAAPTALHGDVARRVGKPQDNHRNNNVSLPQAGD